MIGQAGGRFPLISFEEAKAVTQRAYDLGINYFDNSVDYWEGRAEEVYRSGAPAFSEANIFDLQGERPDPGRRRSGTEPFLEAHAHGLPGPLANPHGGGEAKKLKQIFGPGGAIEAFEAAKKAGKCRFIGFTGHHDPYVHLEMLKAYDKFDSILMPLNVADPGYLSFEKLVLPVATERGMGIQGMKNFGNSKLMQSFSAKECLHYVLSLPISCTAIGCTTIGQLEDDVRFAQEFKPLSPDEMSQLAPPGPKNRRALPRRLEAEYRASRRNRDGHREARMSTLLASMPSARG